MNMHIRNGSALAVALALSLGLLSGCSEKSTATPAALAVDTHQESGEKLTHFTDKSELFVELPSLVVGTTANLTAYLTMLADFKPLAQGKLTVLLSGGTVAEERFVADAPAAAGIFRPSLSPKAAGERELTLIVESPLGTLTHELGPVTVFADAKAAHAGHAGHDHHDAGIAFAKEQQWKVEFATAEAERGMARAAIIATGTIRAAADGEARVVAPAAGVLRASGACPRIGQAVKKGQVRALLTPRLGGDSDQATLEAAAGKARIGLEQARRERERMEALFKEEAVAEKRLLEARAAERIAETEMQAAGARAAGLGGGGGIALKAPIDGVIADVTAAPGAFVNEGEPLLHVANTGKLWLEARVPESEVGRLGTPSGAAFEVDGYAGGFAIEPGRNGRLVAVGQVVDAQSRTVPVLFEFANPERRLRLGLTARVQVFAGGAEEAVLIPASAVQDENGVAVVYLQTGGESFERRIVRSGPRDGERVAILAGVDPGQRVVSKGAYLIRLSTSSAAADGHAGHKH